MIKIANSRNSGAFEATQSISVIVNNPNTLRNVFKVSVKNNEVSSLSEYLIGVSITNPIYYRCSIDIKIPEELTFDDSLEIEVLRSSSYVSLKYDNISEQKVRAKNVFNEYKDGTIYLKLIGITNAPTDKPTQEFQFTTLTGSGSPIDQGSGASLTFKSASRSCSNGEYQLGKNCLPCQNPCDSCNSPKSCISCMVDGDGKKWLLYEDFCYESCPDETFKDGIICKDCNMRCSECVRDSDTCTACKTPYLLYNNQCVSSCPADTTIQQGDACVDCNANCKYCSGDTQTCTACPDDRILQGTTCKPSCDSGFTTTTSFPNECKACSGCLECVDEVTKCTSCDGSKFLYKDSCTDTCPPGSFPHGNVCKSCDASCVTCQKPGVCETCPKDYGYHQGLCLSDCPSGYQKSATGICEEVNLPEWYYPKCNLDN